MRKLIVLALLVVACDSSTGILSGGDAGSDLAAGPVLDLAGVDLGGYSGVGGPCGGNIANPKQCLPGLTCKLNGIPDTGGTCQLPGTTCAANGAACSSGADCCSGNCILRGSPGFCCQPGGCP